MEVIECLNKFKMNLYIYTGYLMRTWRLAHMLRYIYMTIYRFQIFIFQHSSSIQKLTQPILSPYRLTNLLKQLCSHFLRKMFLTRQEVENLFLSSDIYQQINAQTIDIQTIINLIAQEFSSPSKSRRMQMTAHINLTLN